MSRLNIIINDDYQYLAGWIATVPRLFAEGRGQSLYRGRNEVRLLEISGMRVVAKRFKRHDVVKRCIYTFMRPSKARRAYENALALRERGYQTPAAIAYIEERMMGLVTQVYYLCAYTDAQPIRPRLIEQEAFDVSLATSYARYVAAMHQAGVLHRDLNPTNVLFREHGGVFDFELIDINRMRFYDGPVPKDECMENLTLFYWLTPAYRFILDEYARQRGWTQDDVAQAIRVKQRHDRNWVRRKRLTHPFSYKK